MMLATVLLGRTYANRPRSNCFKLRGVIKSHALDAQIEMTVVGVNAATYSGTDYSARCTSPAFRKIVIE